MSGGVALAVGLCVVAGLAGAVQAAIMGRLGDRIGSVEALAFATLATAALAAALLLAVRRGFEGYASALREPPWLWSGAVMGLLIVFTITFAPPRIGTAATIGILIAGQLLMGALIDRFGLFGLEQIPLGWPRVLGIGLLAVGAALSLHKAA